MLPSVPVRSCLNVLGGTWSVVAVTTLLIAVLLLRGRWRESLVIGVTTATASGLSTLMKLLIARPRPLDGIVDTGSDSFPSGHNTTAAALTGAGLRRSAAPTCSSTGLRMLPSAYY